MSSKKVEELTDLEYRVTQLGHTEPMFHNEYNKHFEEGVYCDKVSGVELFSSNHKYDSMTGWPSFFDVIDIDRFIFKDVENSCGEKAREVICKESGSHLGHVFSGENTPTRLRYCINSAALIFKQ